MKRSVNSTRFGGPTANVDLVRDEEFWYDDGSIVLIAQNTGFCVYRALLAMRSEVFRDLFSAPQPNHGEVDLVDNCPVVHVSDTSIALRELLHALLFGKRYIRKDDLALDNLTYRIRLAQKYGIDDLLEESVQELKKFFPTTLAEWDKLPVYYSSRAITAVNLARLTHTTSVLPSALYVCVQLREEVLLDGALHSDGMSDTLSRDDLVTCLRMKVEYARTQTRFIFETFRVRGNFNCRSGVRVCNIAFASLRDVAFEKIETHCHSACNILDKWADFINELEDDEGSLCRACRSGVIQFINEIRSDSWAAVPDYMGVEVEDWA
ncbi:hypothetical protein DAEQUDRAFT_715503 [Daedalea quercina L-15889]|uniref:BTB domain-containing protein n=1 Tax=Daedalea quercina L-15889 TaxID=1314783 RepID=A0A165MSD0_9APHY|nr:hypothetical protein DAEQUDRAFT_715503 [Daedalea quercina L-15889]